MPNIGRAEERNGVSLAPITGDILSFRAKGPVVFRHIAHAAQAKPGNAAKMRRYVKKQPIHRVKILADFFYHHDMAG